MMEFCGLTLSPDLSGALFLTDYSTLVVADLHFEKGSSFARFGLHIPPYDTRSTLDVLEDAVRRFSPQTLICLGDSFHDAGAHERLASADAERIRQLGNGTSIIWITGNHDPDLPEDLPGDKVTEIALGPVVLRHEPVTGAKGEICGHLHPAGIVRQRGRRLRRRCFAANENHLFVPAFGAYTGGLNVRSDAFDRYWRDEPFSAWMIGRRNIHRFRSNQLLK